jgi:hypothetical protein
MAASCDEVLFFAHDILKTLELHQKRIRIWLGEHKAKILHLQDDEEAMALHASPEKFESWKDVATVVHMYK